MKVLSVILIFLLLIGGAYFLYQNQSSEKVKEKYDFECLQQVAEDNCNALSLTFSEVNEWAIEKSYVYHFTCSGFTRERGYKDKGYFFLDEERMRCLK